MTRTEVTQARRIVVKVGSSSLTTTDGGIDPAQVRRLVEPLAAARTRGVEVVLVSSGAIAAGLSPLHLKRRPRGARRPAGRGLGGPGAAGAPLHRGAPGARRRGRAGAAHRRRRDPALALPQRLPDLRQAPRARRAADRQRERHGRHHRDPLRRQRPAGRAGRAPGPRRPAGAALRRRRPVRRSARHPRQRAGAVGLVVGRARLGARRQGRSGGARHRRHADQARRGPDRDRRRHPGGAHRRRAGRAPRWPATRSARSSTPPASAARPGCCGSRTPPSRSAPCCSTPARSPR